MVRYRQSHRGTGAFASGLWFGSRAPVDETARPWPRRRGVGRDHGDGDASITKRSLGRSERRVASFPRTASVPSQTPVAQPIVDSGASGRTVTRPATNASTSLASNRLTAEQTYDDEISRLRTVVAARRSQLDSATIAVIEHNLRVIDQAIAQCKQALRKDPHSQFLMESLNGALDDKVQLLRTAAMLPSRT
jgi:hypothetical protein